MKPRITIAGIVITLWLTVGPALNRAHGDGFNDAVQTIEQFYHVKHQNIPLLARAGIKAVRTAARIKDGNYKRLAEAGSVRVAFFEDQDFHSRGQIANFKTSMQSRLADTWSPVVQTVAQKDEEQNYIYIRTAGEKFQVLVIAIERHEGTVVQATIAPEVLAQLMKDPGDMGRALTEDATIKDN